MGEGQPGRVCVLPHSVDPDRPRLAAGGLLVCGGHRAGIADDLAALPDMHEQLAGQLVPAAAAGGPAGRGGVAPGLTLNPEVSRLRADIHTMLATWCRAIAAEHPSRPASPADSAAATLAAWLARWHDWACAQPWVDDYAAGITDLARWAWAALHPLGRRQFPVGPCGQPVACDVATRAEIRCPGLLRATLTNLDDLLPEHLRCDECARLVPPREWVRLARAGAMLTAAQLHTVWGVPVGTIRRWAHEDRWRRDGRYPMRYDATAAQASYDARRGDPSLREDRRVSDDQQQPTYVYQVYSEMDEGGQGLISHGSYLDEARARRYADVISGVVTRSEVLYDARPIQPV